MRKSIVLTSILSILSISAFADITGSSNCTEGVLGTSTNGSTANIDANWNPNTINIKWYNGDTQLTQTSCQYDTTIVLPTQPTKPGYTFNGWRLRTTPAAPAAPSCNTITDSTTCDGTNGCAWFWGYDNKCGFLPEATPYSSCSEIPDETTCRLIYNQDTVEPLCTWSNGSCHLDYYHDFFATVPSSWCQEAIDDFCYWTPAGQCHCPD